MTAYTDRATLQLTGGTAAVRATLTLGMRELWLDVDGSGNPTGDVWVGDGSTAGGLLLLGYTVSHTFSSGVLVGGLLSANGNLQTVNTLPTWVMWDTTETNVDGGRINVQQFVGETGAGGVHFQHWKLVDHDGASADEKTKIRWYVNRSGTGVGTPDLKMTLDDHLKVQGEARGYQSRITHRYNAAGTTIAATYTDVPFATSVRNDTGFTWGGSDIQLTVGWTGYVELSVDLTAYNTSVNTRGEARWKLQVDTGGGFGDLAGSLAGTYHRNNTGDNTDGYNSATIRRIVACTSGDIYKVQGKSDAGGTIVLMVGGCRFTARRVETAV